MGRTKHVSFLVIRERDFNTKDGNLDADSIDENYDVPDVIDDDKDVDLDDKDDERSILGRPMEMFSDPQRRIRIRPRVARRVRRFVRKPLKLRRVRRHVRHGHKGPTGR